MHGDFWNPLPSVPSLTDSQTTVKIIPDFEVMAVVSKLLKAISVQYLSVILRLLYIWILILLLFTYQFKRLKEVAQENNFYFVILFSSFELFVSCPVIEVKDFKLCN